MRLSKLLPACLAASLSLSAQAQLQTDPDRAPSMDPDPFPTTDPDPSLTDSEEPPPSGPADDEPFLAPDSRAIMAPDPEPFLPPDPEPFFTRDPFGQQEATGRTQAALSLSPDILRLLDPDFDLPDPPGLPNPQFGLPDPDFVLPNFVETDIFGGGSSPARVGIGAIAGTRIGLGDDFVSFQTDLEADADTGFPDFTTGFEAGETLTVLAELMPENNQVALTTELFVVVRVTTPNGVSHWFHKTPAGFRPWDLEMASLEPFDTTILGDVERVKIFEGELPPGIYEVFVAFMQNDRLIHSREPLVMRVQ